MKAKGQGSRYACADMDQWVQEVDWCSLAGVPRRMRFPFPVKTVGWMVVSKTKFSRTVRENGTEFCVRLASSDSVAVDRIGGKTYRTPFPHVVVKRPGVRHEMRYTGFREGFFIIYPPGLEAALRQAGADAGPKSPPIWPVPNAPDVPESIRTIRALFPRRLEPGVADELDALCWALVTRLAALRDFPPAPSADAEVPGPARDSDDARIRAFSASLASRCLKPYPIDFEKEARALGFSRSGFYSRFTALVGEPPERHLANLRLDAAAHLLRESSLSVKQVAFAVRDKSQAHFTRAFRARFGVTPLAWRNGPGTLD